MRNVKVADCWPDDGPEGFDVIRYGHELEGQEADAQDGRLPEVLQMDIDDSKAPISMEEADRIHDEIWADVICLPLEVEQSFIGGRYGDIPHEDGKNVHHMPAKSTLKDISMADGPAIQMDEADHKRTASFGASKDAHIYREIQRQKIQEGNFLEALKMDIEDIQEKFRTKYDQALKNMLDYVKELEPKLAKELDDLKNCL